MAALRGGNGNIAVALANHPSTGGSRVPFRLPFHRPHFVITMGWYRWGRAARRKWVLELLNASIETANLCREWLAADTREHEKDARRTD